MPRVIACILTYLIIFGGIVLILAFTVPTLSSSISEIVNVVPDIVDNAQDFASDVLEKFGDSSQIENYKNTMLDKIESVGADFASTLPNSISKTANHTDKHCNRNKTKSYQNSGGNQLIEISLPKRITPTSSRLTS